MLDQLSLLQDTKNLCMLLEGLECRKLSLVAEITGLCEECMKLPATQDGPRTITVLPEEFAMLLESRRNSLESMREQLQDIRRLREVLQANINNNKENSNGK
jgi:hypothetical protein